MDRGVFTLHHEKMSYFTKQASLDPVNQPLESKNPHKRISSIDDLCVQPQSGNIQQNSEHEGNGVITRKEEEESRPQTHKCVAPPVTTDFAVKHRRDNISSCEANARTGQRQNKMENG